MSVADNRGPQRTEPDYQGGISLTWLARKLEGAARWVRRKREAKAVKRKAELGYAVKKRVDRDWTGTGT